MQYWSILVIRCTIGPILVYKFNNSYIFWVHHFRTWSCQRHLHKAFPIPTCQTPFVWHRGNTLFCRDEFKGSFDSSSKLSQETQYLASILSDTFVKYIRRNISCVQGKQCLHSRWNFISTSTELHGHGDERWPIDVTSKTYFRWPTEVTSKTYFRGVRLCLSGGRTLAMMAKVLLAFCHYSTDQFTQALELLTNSSDFSGQLLLHFSHIKGIWYFITELIYLLFWVAPSCYRLEYSTDSPSSACDPYVVLPQFWTYFCYQ